jgi:hypothetical protein
LNRDAIWLTCRFSLLRGLALGTDYLIKVSCILIRVGFLFIVSPIFIIVVAVIAIVISTTPTASTTTTTSASTRTSTSTGVAVIGMIGFISKILIAEITSAARGNFMG